MKKLTLLIVVTLTITLQTFASYKITCSIVTGDSSTHVNLNRISFTIPEKAYCESHDSLLIANCNASNGLLILHFNSGAVITIHYFLQGRKLPELNSTEDHCKAMPQYCTILETDSILVSNYDSRYGYMKSTNYSFKYVTIYDPEFKMMYSLRIDSPLYENFPDPYFRFKDIIKSIKFF